MPPWRRLPSLGSNVVEGVGTLRLEGGSPAGVWASCPVKALAGAMEAALARALRGESTLLFCSLCFRLGVGLVVFCLCSLFPAKRAQGHGAATARAQVKGCKKVPLLLYTDRSPGPGPHISAERYWARPRMVRGRACGGVFTAVTPSLACASPRPVLNARRGGRAWDDRSMLASSRGEQ